MTEKELEKIAKELRKEQRANMRKLTVKMDKEVKEPHKWEQWELEVLKRIPKEHKYIKSYKEGICIINNINHIPTCLRFKFDTLRDDEKIDIDEELKRNGMSR